MKKSALFFLSALLLAIPVSGSAFETMSPEEMKSVTAQAGIETQTAAVETDMNSDFSASPLPQDQTALMSVQAPEATSRVIKRGAGISIMIDDVRILITSMPDIIFLDNDGV